jgi:hypothetical protein
MADIALVSLALDSTAVVAGEKQATRALHQVDSAMQRTEKQSAQLNTGLNANVKKSGDSFKHLSDSASRAGASLSSLGGPVGRVAGEMSNLGGQLSSLIDSFGLVGGVAIGAVAAIAAVGAAVTKLSLDGVRLSDNLADLGQALGFSEEQMEKLNAAARLAGEDIGVVERSFAAFEGAIKQGLIDPSGEANNALRKLGIDSKVAVKDTHGAFLNLVRLLPEVAGNFEKVNAARELLGRGTNPLIRLGEEYNRILRLTNKELQDLGFTVDAATNRMNAQSDKALNEMSLKWDNFKRQLASEWAPAIVGALESITQAMRDVKAHAPPASVLGGFGIQGIATGIVQRATAPAQIGAGAGQGGAPGRAALIAAGLVSLPPIPPAGKGGAKAIDLAATISDLNEANRASKAYYDAMKVAAESFYAVQITTFDVYHKELTKLDEQFRQAQVENAGQVQRVLEAQLSTLKSGTDNYKRVEDALNKVKEAAAKLAEEVKITTLPAIDKLIDSFRGLKPPLAAAPPISATRARSVIGTNIPDVDQILGTPTRPRIFAETLATRPRRVFGERDEKLVALDQQFEAIFDGFLISVLTAQKTVGQAFGDLAIGVVDQFAVSFTQELRKSFIDPVIKELSNMLNEMLTGLFSGLSSGGGAKGFFGGVAKGIGKIFGGIFGGGGTLGPGKFGIAGERGPELIFSGSQPMHIAPVTAGSAGNVFNISVGVNAPSGTVDKRTQDQLASQVYNAVTRAQRNLGAR